MHGHAHVPHVMGMRTSWHRRCMARQCTHVRTCIIIFACTPLYPYPPEEGANTGAWSPLAVNGTHGTDLGWSGIGKASEIVLQAHLA